MRNKKQKRKKIRKYRIYYVVNNIREIALARVFVFFSFFLINEKLQIKSNLLVPPKKGIDPNFSHSYTLVKVKAFRCERF